MKMAHSRTTCILLCSIVYLPTAQADNRADNEQGYTTESGLNITPILESRLEYNDNIGRYSDAIDPETSFLLDVSPGVVLESDRGGNFYSVGYQLFYGTYFDSSDDNYLDHRLFTENFLRFNIRHALEFNYQFEREHQERGTGIFAGDEFATRALDPIKYQQHSLDLMYIYGVEGGKGRIEVSANYVDMEFQNYRFLTGTNEPFSTSYKDYSQAGAGLAFYYRRSDVSSLFLEVDTAQRDYKRKFNGRVQDSLNLYYFVGGVWEITGVTTGKIRLGLQDMNYDDDSSDDFQGFSWNATLNWTPVEYSALNLIAGQNAQDPDQGVNSQYLESSFLNAEWKHFWQYNIFSLLTLNVVRDDYSVSNRKDDFNRGSIGIGYRFRRDFEALLRWQYEDNDSNLSDHSYTQNAYALMASYRF